MQKGRRILWNPHAGLRLHRAGAVVFEKNYPALPLKNLYVTVLEIPFHQQQQQIILDLKTGLKVPPPAPPTQGKAKKKAV